MSKYTSVTEKMIAFSHKMAQRVVEPRETRERDRSLNGKARIKARKAARR